MKTVYSHNFWGFSLIQTIIAVAIVAIISAATVTLLVNFDRQLRSSSQSLDADRAHATVLTLISSKHVCPIMLDNFTLPANPWTNQTVDLNYLKESTTQILFQLNVAKDNLIPRQIRMERISGPNLVQINVNAGSSSPPSIQNMQQYFVRLSLRFDKEALPGELVPGGAALLPKNYYLSLIINPVSGKIFSCFGGENYDFFQSLCEDLLGGTFNDSFHPYCLINQFILANSFPNRESLKTTPFDLSTRAPYLFVQGHVYAKQIHVDHGDYGSWGGMSTERNWIGKCNEPFCQWQSSGPGSLYLHISGITNTSAGTTGPPNFYPRRIIGLFDSVFLPDLHAQLVIASTANPPPNTHLFVGASSSTGYSRSIHASGEIYADRDIIANQDLKANGNIKAKFDIEAAGNISAGGTVTAASDRKIKSHIRDLKEGLAVILQLKPRRYVKNGREEIGFIAQEVQEALPEVVTEKDGVLYLSYQNMTAVLVNAIKDLYRKFFLKVDNLQSIQEELKHLRQTLEQQSLVIQQLQEQVNRKEHNPEKCASGGKKK
ncbi:MAG: tail fiber domain-containing protein [Bdellovibrionaceae bacterium]|nr:tail fiber domain-containing protein [Pseudobdellovibrionaceae bacterium]MDW8190252.1 tail fiber domain-containing protein [Pseudobdellovibrionaceae bacterium]